jgi:hypothetical protein
MWLTSLLTVLSGSAGRSPPAPRRSCQPQLEALDERNAPTPVIPLPPPHPGAIAVSHGDPVLVRAAAPVTVLPGVVAPLSQCAALARA